MTEFDSFEGAFFTAYLTRPYVFMTWESKLSLKASYKVNSYVTLWVQWSRKKV